MHFRSQFAPTERSVQGSCRPCWKARHLSQTMGLSFHRATDKWPWRGCEFLQAFQRFLASGVSLSVWKILAKNQRAHQGSRHLVAEVWQMIRGRLRVHICARLTPLPSSLTTESLLLPSGRRNHQSQSFPRRCQELYRTQCCALQSYVVFVSG